MHSLLQDLRFAFRQLRRSPAFTLTAVLTLSLGVGAATVMGTVLRGTLLHPLPYPASGDLVGMGLAQPGDPATAAQTGQTIQFLQQHVQGLASLGASAGGSRGENFATGSGTPRSIRALQVSATYLPTLGVTPLLGRTFRPEEDQAGGPAVLVLSESLWKGALAADPAVLGRTVRLNGDPYTVIGVMPSGFTTADAPDLWQPLRLASTDPGFEGTNYQVIARLQPGTSLARLRAQLGGLTSALLQQIPILHRWTPPGAPTMQEFAWPLAEVVTSDARPSLLALSWAVAAVLLIACLNLGGLMVARSAARLQELGIRTALGAGRSALLRLLLAESALLALVGAAGGVVFAWFALPVLLRSASLELPKMFTLALDLRAVAYALCAAGLATVIFGLLPAWATLRGAAKVSLAGARTAGSSASQQRLGKTLLVAQVALATLLLGIGSLLLGTFSKLHSIASGVQPARLEVLQVQLKGDRYHSAAKTGAFVTNLEDRLRRLPGIERVASVYGLPLDGGLNNSGGPAHHTGRLSGVETRFVTPGYFQTVGTSLQAGQDVASAQADSEPTALINAYAAQKWFSGRSGLDEQIVDGSGPPRRVVGIVAPVHNMTLADAQRPTIYLPLLQIDDETATMINGWFPVSFVLRLRAGMNPNAGLEREATTALAAVDPDVAVYKFVSMQSIVDKSVAAPRFFSGLVSLFAGFAVLLTLIGLFGLLSYQVTTRQREIGVRMAVGATRGRIAALVLRRGLLFTALGLVLGIATDLALQTHLLQLLAGAFDLRPKELASVLAGRGSSLLWAALAMLLAATAASALPASRAASIDPNQALRSE